jgi:hypothetical protein
MQSSIYPVFPKITIYPGITNMSNISSRWEWLWGRRPVLGYAIAWSLLSLVIYITFSGPMSGAERPQWYRFLTAYVLQDIPILVSALLCLRNGLSKRMPSGSWVWLLMGIALASYLIGNIFFTSWELLWHLNSTGSLGDPFFVIFYVVILLAMAAAIKGKRIRLNIYHWIVIAIIAAYSIVLANLIMTPAAGAVSSEVSEKIVSYGAEVPGWVAEVDRVLKPHGKNLNLFYVGCDIGLFCMSAIMVFGCWGGQLSQAWRVNAQAIFFIYVADTWYAYAGNQIADYQAGYVLEVGWVLGMVQFGIAATIEFEQTLQRRLQKQNAEEALIGKGPI